MTDAARRQAAGAAAFALLALYLSFPDKVYVFDGIMFAGVVERAVDEWRREVFNPRHVLFNPVFMLLRDALGVVGVKIGGYALFQRVNAVAGAAGIFLYYALVRALAPKSPKAALAVSGALAVAAAYWSRATEGQVYMLMTLGSFATAYAAARLVQAPSPGRAAALALAFSAAIFLHAAVVACAPLCLTAAGLASRKDKRVWLAAPAAAALVAAGYAAAFGLEALARPFAFLGRATEQSSLASLAASGGGAASRVAHVVASLGEAVLGARLPQAGRLALGALLLLAGAAAARAALKDERRPAALLLLAWGAGAVALEALWLGGQFFWAVPVAALLGLCALAFGPAIEARAGLAAAGVAVLGGWNLYATVLPQSRLENNVGYARSMFVRDHTVASSWIVVSGLGFPNQKVYLPYFARRSREVLEYYLNRAPKQEALRQFAAFVQSNVERGIPLYLLPDLVEDPVALGQIEDRWGVSPNDVRSAFGSGTLVEIARQDPSFRVLLFVPERAPERLFAVLGYSVLTESDAARLQETARALKQIGALMSPKQRQTAARVMRESDYGSRLLMEGFAQYMSPESRRAAEERLRRFAEYRKTADFHLRLGNLLRYLGRTEEVKREWRKAYELSGDASLLEQLKSLE